MPPLKYSRKPIEAERLKKETVTPTEASEEIGVSLPVLVVLAQRRHLSRVSFRYTKESIALLLADPKLEKMLKSAKRRVEKDESVKTEVSTYEAAARLTAMGRRSSPQTVYDWVSSGMVKSEKRRHNGKVRYFILWSDLLEKLDSLPRLEDHLTSNALCDLWGVNRPHMEKILVALNIKPDILVGKVRYFRKVKMAALKKSALAVPKKKDKHATRKLFGLVKGGM
jgi:hypothetical protein